MGGDASPFYAMLAICGFLSAVWFAGRFSKMVGVSSIVLEITTGVILGPSILKILNPEYSTCEHRRYIECGAPAGLKEAVAQNLPLDALPMGEFLQKFANDDPDLMYCSHHAYVDKYFGGAHGGHGDESHTDATGDNATSDSHGGHTSDSHGGDTSDSHGGHGRRLSGDVVYDSFDECLVKICEKDIASKCLINPDIFSLIGHTGVALMIFESGMHFNFDSAAVVGPKACAVAVLGTVLPLVTGAILLVIYGRPFFPDGVSAGTALAPTSVGIALKLLSEAKVLDELFGQAIITAAFVDDILSLILFNLLFGIGSGHVTIWTFLKPTIGIVFMALSAVMAVKFWPVFLNDYLTPWVLSLGKPDQKISGADEVLFLTMMVVLVVYALATHLCGTHLWGCFMAGMSFVQIEPPHHAAHVWVTQTKRLTRWMLRVFFAGTVAFSIPVTKLLSIESFLKGSLMGIGPCILTKVGCAFFMGKAKFVIGWAMVGRAEFAYLIAQMAAASKMLDEESFSIVIWALLWATVFAPFIFRYVLNKYVQEEGMLKAGGGDAPADAEHGHGGHEVFDDHMGEKGDAGHAGHAGHTGHADHGGHGHHAGHGGVAKRELSMPAAKKKSVPDPNKTLHDFDIGSILDAVNSDINGGHPIMPAKAGNSHSKKSHSKKNRHHANGHSEMQGAAEMDMEGPSAKGDSKRGRSKGRSKASKATEATVYGHDHHDEMH